MSDEFRFEQMNGTGAAGELPVAPAYSVLVQLQANIGQRPIEIGRKGGCRYCGETNSSKFRNVAHAMPEGLGNKWIVSLDECDACNAIFAAYDQALAVSVGPVLTVGGTQGKGNKVRQTGRSHGPNVISHSRLDGRRRLSLTTNADPGNAIAVDPSTRTIELSAPVAIERFIPRHAYKALVKSGIALLPPDELEKFSSLLAWLRDKDNSLDIPDMTVGLSFGSVGNAPPLVTAALVKRTSDDTRWPYMIFVMTVGSVCFQIALKSDREDGQWPPAGQAGSGLRWTNVIGGPQDADAIRIEYGAPNRLDWSSRSLELTPVELLVTRINLATQAAQIAPVLRKQDKSPVDDAS